MTSIGLLGAEGKMGREVQLLIEGEFADRASLVARVGSAANPADLLASGAVIDFSTPAAVLAFVECANSYEGSVPPLVVGSTGWKLDERRIIEKYAERAPVIMSSNFSVGVYALSEVLRRYTPVFEKLGYNPVIVETHHKHKKDAPSGTALSLQRVISPAGPGNVQTHSIRAGEVIGDHEVTFHGPGDHLVFSHSAHDRSIFARGAIEVALWLADQRKQGKLARGFSGIDTYFKGILGEDGHVRA